MNSPLIQIFYNCEHPFETKEEVLWKIASNNYPLRFAFEFPFSFSNEYSLKKLRCYSSSFVLRFLTFWHNTYLPYHPFQPFLRRYRRQLQHLQNDIFYFLVLNKTNKTNIMRIRFNSLSDCMRFPQFCL